MTEKLLIDRARQGDRDAFRLLVERSRVTTYRLAYDLTGNRHDAEDLSQEAYIRAYRGLGSFRGEAKWSSWLHRITVNTFLDHKKVNRNNSVEYDDNTDIEPAAQTGRASLSGEAQNPERRAEAGVIREHVEKALGSLSPTERSVFVMRHYHDLTIRDISAALGIAEGTVKVHLFRGLRRLQKRLEFFRAELGPTL